MTVSTKQNVITITQDKQITLPEHILQASGLISGDKLVICWSPPDTILIRKLPSQVMDDNIFTDTMQEFGQALEKAGYGTNDGIIELVKEVKTEQVAEWSHTA